MQKLSDPARRGAWRRGLGRTSIATAIGTLATAAPAHAHDVSEQAKQMMLDGGLLDAVWIGGEHMLTGYDHMLFLLGVLFFLNNVGQIVRFITAFTIGHTITLLGATMFGITANAYLIDAVIALTVCYKAFENLGLFRRWLGVEAPNLLYMVFLFGLIHGFGLSTRLQQMTLIDDPQIVPKILAFNVGVELGQIAALCVMVGVVRLWRQTTAWQPVMRTANAALFLAGATLFVQQIAGFASAPAETPLAVRQSAPLSARPA